MTKALAEIKDYRWRKGTQAPQEWAPVFGQRMDWLQDRLGHAPTSKEVYEDAQDKHSPIHKMFNWDDEEAAEKFRRMQASVLSSSLVVKIQVVQNGKRMEVDSPVRIVINGNKRRHERVEDVMNNAEMKAMMLEMATDELLNLQRRHSQIKELGLVFYEADVVRKKVLPKVKKEAERAKTKQITLK